MKNVLRAAALSLASLWAPFAGAQSAANPVVIELFTSQGCSSCPPADALLHELAERDGVIALALHVDYWDYIGWKDEFANPAFSNRQRNYARVAGKRMVYTPQMVIGGSDHVVGTKPMAVADLLASHAEAPNPVQVSVAKKGGRITVNAQAVKAFSGQAQVHVVQVSPKETVRITRGENRGRTLSYANIVRGWKTVAEWDGQAPLEVSAKVAGNLPVAIIVQSADYGEILGAAILR